MARLLDVLQRLASSGNTILVIEHNLDVIKCSDWIIDLGPEGGDRGGTIVAQGPPEEVARNERSYTGHYLRPLLPDLGTSEVGTGSRKGRARKQGTKPSR